MPKLDESHHKNTQLLQLSSLRGFAALMVCFMHLSQQLIPNTHLLLSEMTPVFDKAYLYVDFFFILSGFILAHVYIIKFSDSIQPNYYSRFMLSRFARIYPLHLFTLSIILVIEIGEAASYVNTHSFQHLLSVWPYGENDLVFSNPNSPTDFVLNILLLNSISLDSQYTSWNHPSWSIGAEWLSYFLVPFWLYLFFGKKLSTTIGMVISSALVFCALVGLVIIETSSVHRLDAGGLLGLGRCILDVILGVVGYKCYLRFKEKKVLVPVMLLPTLLTLLFLVMHFNLMDVLTLPLFLSIIIVVNFDKGRFNSLLSNKYLVYLGTVSYSIYLLHIPLKIIITKIGQLLLIMPINNSYTVFTETVFLFCTMLTVVLVSHWSYKWVELPSKELILRWNQKRGKKSVA